MPAGVDLVRVHPSEAARVALARTLFREYADSLAIDLSFQNFADEMEAFPAGYVPPEGALILALRGDDALGCIGVRRFDTGVCEMKRLYVRAGGRGSGLGRRLCEAALDAARKLGYSRMRLDTLADMTAARKLYRQLGFKEIAPYYYNPVDGTSYMERGL